MTMGQLCCTTVSVNTNLFIESDFVCLLEKQKESQAKV